MERDCSLQDTAAFLRVALFSLYIDYVYMPISAFHGDVFLIVKILETVIKGFAEVIEIILLARITSERKRGD